MTAQALLFPRNFLWGTATSAHQVEGNLTNNDWWAAERQGGYVWHNQTAGQACDWWNRAEEDFDRMAEMGQNTHRMSVEWSRIEPRQGVWDEGALARYREMVEGLIRRGIHPMITLHHFTNPLWMAEQGGWENEEAIGWFARYVRKVVGTLGDLVNLWCTINEPEVLVAQGYQRGVFPPGKRDFNLSLRVGLNVLRAHGAAYHTIHEQQPNAQVGLAKHMMIWQPWRPWLPNDQLAANLVRHFFNNLALDAVIQGIMRVPGQRKVLPELRGTLDWLGINYYQRFRVRTGLFSPRKGLVREVTRPGVQKGPGPWGEIFPRGLFDTLRQMARYKLPLIITENGIPDEHDMHRPAFILTHLHNLWKALKHNVPVLGYYFWSLVDNFEWTEGYDPRFRFGLIGVDFETQERQIRKSGWLYAAICRRGGIDYEIAEQYAPEVVPELFGRDGNT
jgi:beta-glucosidase